MRDRNKDALLYFGPIVFVLVLLVVTSVLPGGVLPGRDAYANWSVSLLALVVAWLAFVHTLTESRRLRRESRPDLAADLTSIGFNTAETDRSAPKTPRGMGSITFSLRVRNRGNAETSIVACWLVRSGATRDEAVSLLLSPERVRIACRDQTDVTVKLLDPDVQKYRNLSATLYLRDASDREYPVQIAKISPAWIGHRIADMDVRED